MPGKLYRGYDVPEVSRIDLWHMDGIVVNGNPVVTAVNTALYFNFQAQQSPAAANDDLYHPVWLKKGTYTLKMLYHKIPNSGILTLRIADQQYSVFDYTTAIDFHVAVNTLNQVFTDTAVTIARDGYHRVYFSALSKNAGSTGYILFITKTTLYRTGD